MKLVRVGAKVHLPGKPIIFFAGRQSAKMPTMKCNQKQSLYALGGHVFEFEGEMKDVTCKKCIKPKEKILSMEATTTNNS